MHHPLPSLTAKVKLTQASEESTDSSKDSSMVVKGLKSEDGGILENEFPQLIYIKISIWPSQSLNLFRAKPDYWQWPKILS